MTPIGVIAHPSSKICLAFVFFKGLWNASQIGFRFEILIFYPQSKSDILFMSLIANLGYEDDHRSKSTLNGVAS